MRTRETEATLDPALFVSSFSRTATRGENKGKVTQVSFRVLTPEGRPTLVIAARDSLDWVKEKFPDIPGKLIPVSFSPLMKREDVLSGATTFFVIPSKTVLKVAEDKGDIAFNLEVLPIHKAIEKQEKPRKKDERDPFSVIYGSISDVRVFVDRETGELTSVKATLEDMDGETITTKLEQNLEELTGSQPWIDEPETDKIRNALLDMPILAGGRVYIGKAGDELNNAKTGETSILEEDVTSFVVKRGGWVTNLETATPSVYKAVMKALETKA
jgi:hypothetical protein